MLRSVAIIVSRAELVLAIIVSRAGISRDKEAIKLSAVTNTDCL